MTTINSFVGVAGAGAMGSGIAQVALQNGHKVILYDIQQHSLDKARNAIQSGLTKWAEKTKMPDGTSEERNQNLTLSADISALSSCDIIIEAIAERIEIKKDFFGAVSQIVKENCILASNTSSLSLTSIASACKNPGRFIGLHFFNPAPLMALVEIIPAVQTEQQLATQCAELIMQWGKIPVICRDTPGFIVNRIARPFYSEALRILEENIASVETIDAAMKSIGFRMGPFELMDLIGHDVNYAVTESVFQSLYFDPRYRPSVTQKRLTEAGWLGKKTGRGFYNYDQVNTNSTDIDKSSLTHISDRIITMLINEAYDALHFGVANEGDIDTAMTKGVNYPKGLIQWGREMGLDEIAARMNTLYQKYQEDRYRLSPGISSRI
ncbi:MAG: 3-hydroxyacyl-CoA dehydrogenase NAD-binding domain-containing protein [Flavobacteriales bacterium]